MATATSNKPWIDAYETHEWKVYDLTPEEFPELSPTHLNFHITNAEAPKAETLWKHGVTNVFYSDLEQMAADLSGRCGSHGDIRMLAADWRGHTAGALVHAIYTDAVYQTPPKFTYMVEAI